MHVVLVSQPQHVLPASQQQGREVVNEAEALFICLSKPRVWKQATSGPGAVVHTKAL